MKYKAGDKVKIKSLEWYNTFKDEDGVVDCGQWYFDKKMSRFCGKIVTICESDDMFNWYRIREENDSHIRYNNNMIECLVEEKNNDNCKDFIWLYNFVTHLDLISHQLPIKVNGKKVINAKLTDNFEIELITEE